MGSGASKSVRTVNDVGLSFRNHLMEITEAEAEGKLINLQTEADDLKKGPSTSDWGDEQRLVNTEQECRVYLVNTKHTLQLPYKNQCQVNLKDLRRERKNDGFLTLLSVSSTLQGQEGHLQRQIHLKLKEDTQEKFCTIVKSAIENDEAIEDKCKIQYKLLIIPRANGTSNGSASRQMVDSPRTKAPLISPNDDLRASHGQRIDEKQEEASDRRMASRSNTPKVAAVATETFSLDIKYDNRTIVIEVTPNSSIGDIKRQVEKLNHLPFRQQEILINGESMNENCRLSEYGIRNSKGKNDVQLKILSGVADKGHKQPEIDVTDSSSNTQANSELYDANFSLIVGSMVEFESRKTGKVYHGIIRWIGDWADDNEDLDIWAGLELEEKSPTSKNNDGRIGETWLYQCQDERGIFVQLYRCRKDSRFLDPVQSDSADSVFGSRKTEDISGDVYPSDISNYIYGQPRGIQGHHNSCYMDATLFAMFAFSRAFDALFDSSKKSKDQNSEAKRVLKEGIVNPLRRDHYVSADKVSCLRQLLDNLNILPGMMADEKDPEEFLTLLFGHVFKVEPFLKICSQTGKDQDSYMYQLISEKDDALELPTTQELFERSFLEMDLKLKKVPSCLILQMPRFGKDYKMYERIILSTSLDITDVLENAPRACVICESLASHECLECRRVFDEGLLRSVVFCDICYTQVHKHRKRLHHRSRPLEVDKNTKKMYLKQSKKAPLRIPRHKMELSAIVCIRTSHYVSFAKCSKDGASHWVFFDSMADREGGENGYNIPEIKECDQLSCWFDASKRGEILQTRHEKDLPEPVRRVLCDAYLCIYQFSDAGVSH